jgi:hypothetical protein
MKTPKLSIVVASRNDNHGGDMTRRMRLFINGLIHQANKFKCPIELIMVEWNPPADKPLLHKILPQPTANDYLSLRYIVVPESIHRQYELSSKLPLFQMTAKNVGIRRAKAEFVLCTNIDILFSDEIFQYFTQTKFEQNKYYRANRCDIPSDIDELLPIDAQLKYCAENIIERHGINVDFYDLIGLPALLTGNHHIRKFTRLAILPFRKFLYPLKSIYTKIDFMACGDFTLMSKTDWLRIEAYPELDLYSLHIDSMALIAAQSLGLAQIILPTHQCVYHIDHQDGWARLNPIQTWLFLKKRPSLDWSTLQNWGDYIIPRKATYGINKPDWGFANEKFEEVVFNRFE